MLRVLGSSVVLKYGGTELCFGGSRESSRLEDDLDCREVGLDIAGVPNLLTLLHEVNTLEL